MSVSEDIFARRRRHMVVDQIARRGIQDAAVLAAMGEVPRHQFIPQRSQHLAYGDHPVPIGLEQTISQPYIVALMSELASIRAGDRVLDIGTGSGYQAAVLASIGADVHTVEIIDKLASSARDRLTRLGYQVRCHHGDGRQGWPQAAPYRAILVAAAPRSVPPLLIDQLEIGGRLILPVGDRMQELVEITRTPTGIDRRRVMSVLFVPMTSNTQV